MVGLYIDPPAKAIVLCVDEKPSIQALERAQGYLRLPNGRALTGQSHDYKRHGTTTLFAALEVATGRIIAAHSKRRRRVEFLGFMNRIVAAFPARELHVILDNLNTHKKCDRWLKKHPERPLPFHPNPLVVAQSDRTWFSILQGQSLTGASFTSVEQLQEHIDAFIAAYNENATPFAWTKKKVYQRRFKNRRITQVLIRVLVYCTRLMPHHRVAGLPAIAPRFGVKCSGRLRARPRCSRVLYLSASAALVDRAVDKRPGCIATCCIREPLNSQADIFASFRAALAVDSHAPNGLDIVLPIRCIGELFPHLADEHVDDLDLRLVHPAIEMVEEHFLGERHAFAQAQRAPASGIPSP